MASGSCSAAQQACRLSRLEGAMLLQSRLFPERPIIDQLVPPNFAAGHLLLRRSPARANHRRPAAGKRKKCSIAAHRTCAGMWAYGLRAIACHLIRACPPPSCLQRGQLRLPRDDECPEVKQADERGLRQLASGAGLALAPNRVLRCPGGRAANAIQGAVQPHC